MYTLSKKTSHHCDLVAMLALAFKSASSTAVQQRECGLRSILEYV